MPKTTDRKRAISPGRHEANGRQATARVPERALLASHVAEGVERSYRAFLKALPNLLQDPRLRRQWAAFHDDNLVATSGSETKLIHKCLGLGFPSNSFYVGWIAPEGPGFEEIDPSLFEFVDAPLGPAAS